MELSHVSFGYQKDKVILKDFSMKAPKGSLIAIVGPTGAGKTTFINLLMRFYDIDSGSILVDGRNISDITRKSLRLSLLHGPPRTPGSFTAPSTKISPTGGPTPPGKR